MKTTINKILSAIRHFFTAEVGRPESRPVVATGGCEHIQALLLHLCAGDEQRALWVRRWLALPLRKPGTKMRTALIVNAENGTGKTLFFGELAPACAPENRRMLLCHWWLCWFGDVAGRPDLCSINSRVILELI